MNDPLKGVRDALHNPVEPPVSADYPGDDRHHGPNEGRPMRVLPDGCPVIPVGTEDGLFYFLTALGELRGLKPDQVANRHIVAMFAPDSQYLLEQWPRRKQVAVTDENGDKVEDDKGNVVKEWITTGWHSEDVSNLLMDVAARQGVWNARERVRGKGSWLGDDGSLIIHAGSHVLTNGIWQRPGLYDKMVYPSATPVPRPAAEVMRAIDIAPGLAVQLKQRGVEVAENITAGQMLLELFKLWNWARPFIDPMLLLGWNIAGIMGSANPYRPLAWITGDKATGKSALQMVVGMFHGGGLLQTPDASEAAIRQLLGQQSLPVAIDEAEAEEDNRKMLALVKLARLAASSQGNIVRGGADHQAHEFRATSCFLFSSILVPPIPPQDKSRLSVLELGELPAGSREPRIDKREIEALGAQIRRQIVDRWQHWPDVLEAYRDAMIDFGKHGGRIADQFGTLLAAAHLVLSDGPPDLEELHDWGQLLSIDHLAEASDNADDATRCGYHLLTSPVQLAGHGAPRLVSDWLGDATEPNPWLPGDMQWQEAQDKRASAERMLGKVGMRIFVGAAGGSDGPNKPMPGREYVAVASNHQGLAKIFDQSRWNRGVWSQSLGRVQGAVKNYPIRIAKVNMKATLVPISALIDHSLESEKEKETENG